MQAEAFSVADRELVERAKKRGRAYQCLACYYNNGKVYVNEKLKVEDHIYKTHVRPDEIPFYCRLCHFHCQREDQLQHHIENYQPHKKIVDEKGYPDKGRSFLMRSTKPHVIGPLDYLRYEPADSLQHWLRVMKVNQVTASSTRTPVTSTRATPITATSQSPSCSSSVGGSSVQSIPSLQSHQPLAQPIVSLNTQTPELTPLPAGGQVMTQTPMLPSCATPVQSLVALPFHEVHKSLRSLSELLEEESGDWLDWYAEGGPTQSDKSLGLQGQVGLNKQKLAEDHTLSAPNCRAQPTNTTCRVEHNMMPDPKPNNNCDYPEEDITDQLLGYQDEDLSIQTPRKRPATPTNEDPIPEKRRVEKENMKQPGEEKDGPEFSVSMVAVNSMVEVMTGLREVIGRTLKAIERIDKDIKDNTCEMGKMIDSMSRLRRTVEEKERQDAIREERRLNWEKRQEDEKWKERDDERRREEKRRETERRDKNERRRKEKDKQDKENTLEPKVRSVLGRSYTEASVRDQPKRR